MEEDLFSKDDRTEFDWNSKVGFGKYADLTIDQVYDQDWGYIKRHIEKDTKQPIILWVKNQLACYNPELSKRFDDIINEMTALAKDVKRI